MKIIVVLIGLLISVLPAQSDNACERYLEWQQRFVNGNFIFPQDEMYDSVIFTHFVRSGLDADWSGVDTIYSDLQEVSLDTLALISREKLDSVLFIYQGDSLLTQNPMNDGSQDVEVVLYLNADFLIDSINWGSEKSYWEKNGDTLTDGNKSFFWISDTLIYQHANDLEGEKCLAQDSKCICSTHENKTTYDFSDPSKVQLTNETTNPSAQEFNKRVFSYYFPQPIATIKSNQIKLESNFESGCKIVYPDGTFDQYDSQSECLSNAQMKQILKHIVPVE